MTFPRPSHSRTISASPAPCSRRTDFADFEPGNYRIKNAFSRGFRQHALSVKKRRWWICISIVPDLKSIVITIVISFVKRKSFVKYQLLVKSNAIVKCLFRYLRVQRTHNKRCKWKPQPPWAPHSCKISHQLALILAIRASRFTLNPSTQSQCYESVRFFQPFFVTKFRLQTKMQWKNWNWYTEN